MFDISNDVDPLVAALLQKPSMTKPKLQAFNAAPIDGTEAQLALGAATNPITALPAVAAILRNNDSRDRATELTRQYNDAALQAMRPDPQAATNAFFAEAMKHPHMLPVVVDYMRQQHMPVTDESLQLMTNGYGAEHFNLPMSQATNNAATALGHAIDAGYRPTFGGDMLSFGRGEGPMPEFTRVPSKNEIHAENGRLHADALKGSVSHTQDNSVETTEPVVVYDPSIKGNKIVQRKGKSATTDKADLKGNVQPGATAPPSAPQGPQSSSAEDAAIGQLVDAYAQRGTQGVQVVLDKSRSTPTQHVYNVYTPDGKQAKDFVYNVK